MIMDDVEVITKRLIPKIVKRTTSSEERIKKEMNFAMRVFGLACWLCGALVGGAVAYIIMEVIRNG